MALSDYEVKETEIVVLNDALGSPMIADDGKKIEVEIYSPGSVKFARAVSKKNASVIDMMRKKGKTDADEERDLLSKANFLADCTKSISDNIKPWFPGKEGRALLVAVYSHRPIGFVKDQISEKLEDWANFTQDSTKA